MAVSYIAVCFGVKMIKKIDGIVLEDEKEEKKLKTQLQILLQRNF